MSQENVEVVRRVLEAWNRRDTDASRQYLAPDVEWEPATPSIVEGAVHRGLDEVMDATAALWEIWDVFRFEEAEIRDLDPAVVWLGRVHIKGSASHVELDQEFGVRCVLNDGMITRAKAFLSWREALEAAGLQEQAMSQENVEAVNTLFAAFARRDLEAAAGVLDPSVEVRPAIVGGPERVVYHGLDGMRQFWADIDAAWAEFRITPEEFRELDGEILVLGRAFARGRKSGIVIDAAAAWIARLRQGKIVGFRSFSNPQNALEAAGLEE